MACRWNADGAPLTLHVKKRETKDAWERVPGSTADLRGGGFISLPALNERRQLSNPVH